MPTRYPEGKDLKLRMEMENAAVRKALESKEIWIAFPSGRVEKAEVVGSGPGTLWYQIPGSPRYSRVSVSLYLDVWALDPKTFGIEGSPAQ